MKQMRKWKKHLVDEESKKEIAQDRLTDRETDRQTHCQKDRQTDKQSEENGGMRIEDLSEIREREQSLRYFSAKQYLTNNTYISRRE